MINEGFYQSKDKYDFQRTVKRNKDFIIEDDVFLISKYVEYKERAEHISKVRKYKLSTVLVTLRKFITVPYREMSLDDVLAGIDTMKNANSIKYRPGTGESFNGPKLKQGTVYDYVTVLKTFLTWLSENEICEKCGTVNDLTRTKCANRKCNHQLKREAINPFNTLELKKIIPPKRKDKTEQLDEKDILTPAEVKQLIKATRTIRDRALLSLLYESGARCGEVGRAVWDDADFDKYGVSLNITDTKTSKKRYTRLIESTEALSTWRNQHPHPEGQQFIFINPDGTAMTYTGMKRVLERAHARTDIKKPVRLHMLRHARATHLIQQNYNIEKVKQSLWGNLSTKMIDTYVSLGKESIDEEWLRQAGIEVEKGDQIDDSMKPRTCGTCGHVWPHDTDYCPKDGTPLTGAAIDEKAKWEQKGQDYIMNKLKEMEAEIQRLRAGK